MVESQCIYTTLTGFSYYYLGVGAEIGYDAANGYPNSIPVNQQPYIDALVACAARSQIQERLAEADAAQADLTAEEVENQNRQFIAFRDCMVGRGWGIPEPVPNEQGLLFGGFASTASWVAPPGESLTTSDDLGECQSEAGASAGGD